MKLGLALLLLPAIASAEPADPGRWYATAAACTCTAGLKGSELHGTIGWDLALGLRLGDWWLRGALTRSNFTDGSYGFLYEPRAGIERRTFDNPNASAFFGLDAGWLRGSAGYDDALGDMSLRGGFVMPRAGIEGGFEHLRIRLSLELVVGYGHDVNTDGETNMTVRTSGFMDGGNLELGFTVR